MSRTRGGETTSAQIGKIGVISDLSIQNFRSERVPVNIKNEGDDAVTLEVNLWGMNRGEFVATKFYPGWNPEIVREIRSTDQDVTLLWGF